MATYTVPSGDRIWAGRGVVMPDPDDVSFTWPPGANCTIPDAEGVNAPIHPKVLDFGASGWNGYRYWMTYTQYPTDNNDDVENPSVVASSDGDEWVAPATNPIFGEPATGFYSDSHLEYCDGELYLFWRWCEFQERIMMSKSSDGETWSSAVEVYRSPVAGQASVLSPSILFWNGKWRIWAINVTQTPSYGRMWETTDLFNWGDSTDFALTLADAGRECWHADVVRVPNGWAMLISDKARGSYAFGYPWVAFSSNGINWAIKSTRMGTGAPAVYRSTFVKTSSGFDCWYTDYSVRKIKRGSITMGV